MSVWGSAGLASAEENYTNGACLSGGPFAAESGTLTEISVRLSGTFQNFGLVRAAIYQGGSSTDPAGATLICDSGQIAIPNAAPTGAYGLAADWGATISGSLTASSPTWIVTKWENASISLNTTAAGDLTYFTSHGRVPPSGITSSTSDAFPSTFPTGGVSGSFEALVAQLVYTAGSSPPPDPTITDVDTDETILDGQTGVVVTGTDLGTTNANRTFALVQGATSVDQVETGTGTDTAATLTIAVDAASGGDIKFGAATLEVTRDDDATGSLAVTVDPPAGQLFVDIGTPNTTASNRITAVPDIASGDQLQARGVGGGAAPTGLTLNDDATFSFAAGDTPANFDVRVWDSTDSTWGAWATQTASSGVGDLDSTLASLSAAASGQLAIAGSLLPTLSDIGLSGSGQLFIAGTLSATLGAVTVNAAGNLDVRGNLSAALDALALAAAGEAVSGKTGELERTLAALTVAAAAKLDLAGLVAASLADLATAAEGQLQLSGALSRALDALSLSSSGAFADALSASLNVTLADIAALSDGRLLLAGDLTATLGDVTLPASNMTSAYLVGSIRILPALSGSASIRPALSGSVSIKPN